MSIKAKEILLAAFIAALSICLTCSDKSTGPQEIPAPEIASISPERGPVGTRVEIRGEHFGDKIGSILFGERAPYVALWSDTLIQADAPSQIKEPCYIYIRNDDKKKDSIWFVVEYLQIESITPDHGLPGNEITITGQNFGSTTGIVLFDSLEADIVSWSSMQIMARVPENATSCNVEVHTGNMVSNLRGFAIDKMTITQIIPNRAIPNTEVEIHGYKFGEQAGTVQFPDALGEVISWSDTLIIAKVPIGATSGDVHVEVGGAPSNAISFNVEELYISNITPESAPYGAEIEIHGTFYGATGMTVIFGDVEIEAEDFNDTLIVMTIPGEVNSGDIKVSANGLLSNEVNFEVLHMNITSVEPDSGIVGQRIKIHGMYFGSNPGSVYFGEIQGVIEDWSDSLISTKIPLGAVTGSLRIENFYESTSFETFKVIESSDLVYYLQNTTHVSVSFNGYHLFLDCIFNGCDSVYETKEITISTSGTDPGEGWDGLHFYGHYEYESSDNPYYVTYSVSKTCNAWVSYDGTQIDSLVAKYGVHDALSDMDYCAYSRKIVLKNLPLENINDTMIAVSYMMEGPEVELILMEVFYFDICDYVWNATRESYEYVTTVWDYIDPKPIIRVSFWQ